jgi:hypothetical protein
LDTGIGSLIEIDRDGTRGAQAIAWQIDTNGMNLFATHGTWPSRSARLSLHNETVLMKPACGGVYSDLKHVAGEYSSRISSRFAWRRRSRDSASSFDSAQRGITA